MHDTNKQTLLQQLDISVAYMCDFLHCVAKGFPQKVIIGVFFFSFVSRLDHRHQGSQVGLSAGVLHAAATITNEQITNSQTNDKKKKNKQTKNTHPHANNRMLPSLFFFPFFQNENKIGRSVWSVEDSNMKNKQRKRTLKQRKCWSAGGKATIKKSVRLVEKGEKCLPSFFKLFFSHPWAAFGRIGDKHGKLGFRAQDSVGSHFNFFFFWDVGEGPIWVDVSLLSSAVWCSFFFFKHFSAHSDVFNLHVFPLCLLYLSFSVRFIHAQIKNGLISFDLWT